jgi:exodeoxyribonuclease V gamma subunit
MTTSGATVLAMLHVHRAERADRLADGLAQTLLAPLEDPFAPEVVAVPTRGVERWLTQRLSTRLGASASANGRDGVCANVEFPFPGRLIQAALAEATGVDPETDPWLAERAVWPLLEVADECLSDPWLSALARHLEGARGDTEDPPRRFGVIRHIADLFDRYGVHRPSMVQGWAAGDDGPAGGWQPELWRRLRARIEVPSPAERLDGACERIRRDPGLLGLPARLSLFGLTRLPRSYLEVLAAVAAGRDVHLFVLHPSPSLWNRVAGELASGPAIATRRRDRTAGLPVNRLLASWGRDVRELQLVLAGAGPGADHHHELRADASGTLLAAIQQDIRSDRQPPGPPVPGHPDGRLRLDPADRSIQIHACHGRARQVEVLRDAVLHLLAEDPTLEPRDVIVMCPDIETFAPLIQASFGSAARASDPEPDHADEARDRLPDLRVRLADRALRQTNPVLGVLSEVLALADQRATASQLLDLASREPVRRRFAFDDDALARIQDWVAASGIRWGFDAPHREPFQLGTVSANTWRRGLDRILVGVAMTEEERPLLGGVLALDDVESGAIDLAGRFAEFVDRVHAAVQALSHAQPIRGWTEAMAGLADALTATSDRDSWQRRELQRLLDDVANESAGGTGGPREATLELADVRALLADRLRGRPTRANFRTGHLTVCTLVPMRSVPHRVVCLLGLDDGEYPRRARRDGDDLMLAEPHVGDRDPRAEDRQMLLDALLAATERLIITYTGHDERTNVRRPPAVPVGELLDVVERTVRCDAGTAREAVVIHHPLQPFDPRNFTPGKLLAGQSWGFDPQALAGARALSGHRAPRGPFLSAALPPRSETVVELAALVRFVEHPVRALLRDRLGISVSDYSDEVKDAMPVQLDALEEWGVGQRLLEGVLAGGDRRACMQAEVARGALPPGELARPTLARIVAVVDQVADAARTLAAGTPASLDVSVALPDARTVVGTVTGVCGDTIRAVSYSRVRARDRLRAWVRLLALSAARPERPFESVVIGRARAGAPGASVTVARIPPLAADPDARRHVALEQLGVLLDLYDRGMREPLPLACETSAAYAQAVVDDEDPEPAARAAWETVFRYDKEDRQPEHLLVYGGAPPLAGLLASAPREDERGPGWEEGLGTRFGRYAMRLWRGLLAVEELRDR